MELGNHPVECRPRLADSGIPFAQPGHVSGHQAGTHRNALQLLVLGFCFH